MGKGYWEDCLPCGKTKEAIEEEYDIQCKNHAKNDTSTGLQREYMKDDKVSDSYHDPDELLREFEEMLENSGAGGWFDGTEYFD